MSHLLPASRLRRYALVLAAVASLVPPRAAVLGQEPTPLPPPMADWEYAQPTVAFRQLSGEASALTSAAVAPSTEELLERLAAAESRIAALELQPPSESPAESFQLPEAPEAPELPEPEPAEEAEEEESEPKWFDKYTFRGYAQFRWNAEMGHEPGSAPAQAVGDRSVGPDQNFLIRRARLIFAADISDHFYVYLQPDFANAPTGSPDQTFFGQIRDWYGDIYWDATKVNRFRVGQSKLPYGWENMQSSSNRLPLDRNDGLNSAQRNERDLGVFYYWTPEHAQEIFTWVNDQGLKGSGNYGVFGIGCYNGQGGSMVEQNDNLHLVTRLTCPFFLSDGQLVEFSVQGYTGKYAVSGSAISPLGVGPAVTPGGTLSTGNRGIRDERIAWTAVVYPQPFGFQTEWNVGRGPGLNDAQTDVVERPLYGGYAMMFYRLKTACYGEIWPFARYNRYKGGYKTVNNAPFSQINEYELGVEWQMNEQVELVTMFTFTDRTNTTALNTADALSYRQFQGDLFRTQLQINY